MLTRVCPFTSCCCRRHRGQRRAPPARCWAAEHRRRSVPRPSPSPEGGAGPGHYVNSPEERRALPPPRATRGRGAARGGPRRSATQGRGPSLGGPSFPVSEDRRGARLPSLEHQSPSRTAASVEAVVAAVLFGVGSVEALGCGCWFLCWVLVCAVPLGGGWAASGSFSSPSHPWPQAGPGVPFWGS